VSDYLSQVLGDDHHLDAFTCGKDPLDDWLKTQARRAQGAGTARTYVWIRPGSPDVLAYFSIAPTQVVRAEVPSKLTGGYSVIPAYLLARLALDHTLHGQGLGGQLLLDALARIVDAATVGGGRLIVVDAVDDQAAAFYRRHDFVTVGDSPRLYLKVTTAETVLAKAP
jgi:ribosomal protein S18 acetylase RimI-like enzyme